MLLPGAIGHSVQVRGYSGTLSVRGSATLIDNVPVNSMQYGTSVYSINNLQLGLLDSIEVVRGPGSAMYGSDAFHSSVSYHTFTRSDVVAEFSLEAGEKGFYQTSAKFSQPLNDSLVINVAIAGSGQDTQDLQQSYTDPILGQQTHNYPYEIDDRSAIIKLHNAPSSSATSFTFSIIENQEDHPSLSGFGSREDKNNQVLGEFDLSGQATDSSLYTFKLSHAVSDSFEVNIDTYYRESQGGFYLNTIDANNSQIITNVYDLDEEHYGLHIGVSKTLDALNSQWALVAGMTNHQVTKFQYSTVNPVTGFRSDKVDIRNKAFSDQTIDDVAFEGKTRFFDDKFIITYGARVDKYPDFSHQISPRFSAIYHPDEGSAIKFIYGNAFRAPVIGEKAGLGSTVSGDKNLSPEEIDSYELVYMQQGSHWKAEIVYYQSKFKKGLAIVSKVNPLPGEADRGYVNFAEQESEGIEASYSYLYERWFFSVNASVVNSENITANEEHTAYPKWLANYDVGYKFSELTTLHITTQMFGGHDLGDKITANGADVETAGTYIRSDLHAAHSFNENINVWLNIKNILDKDNVFPSIFNSEGGIPDTGRSLSVGGTYQF